MAQVCGHWYVAASALSQNTGRDGQETRLLRLRTLSLSSFSKTRGKIYSATPIREYLLTTYRVVSYSLHQTTLSPYVLPSPSISLSRSVMSTRPAIQRPARRVGPACVEYGNQPLSSYVKFHVRLRSNDERSLIAPGESYRVCRSSCADAQLRALVISAGVFNFNSHDREILNRGRQRNFRLDVRPPRRPH